MFPAYFGQDIKILVMSMERFIASIRTSMVITYHFQEFTPYIIQTCLILTMSENCGSYILVNMVQ